MKPRHAIVMSAAFEVVACGVAACALCFCSWGLRPASAEDTTDRPAAEAAADDEMPKDPAKLAEWQQRQQIRQQSKQFEPAFRRMLKPQLELIRQTCPGLSPQSRSRILSAGKTAVPRAAQEFARRQMTGRADDKSITGPWDFIERDLEAAVQAEAKADEFAAYRRELEFRAACRRRAAVTRIVRRVDGELLLTEEQRREIREHLDRDWQAAWLKVLGEGAWNINGYEPAPDFAAACIMPHLTAGQAEDWRAWCEAAGSERHNVNTHNFWNEVNLFLQAAQEGDPNKWSVDPWWGT